MEEPMSLRDANFFAEELRNFLTRLDSLNEDIISYAKELSCEVPMENKWIYFRDRDYQIKKFISYFLDSKIIVLQIKSSDESWSKNYCCF